MSALLDLIKSRPVFYDGSMGATILNLGLTPEDYGGQSTEGYNDYLSVVKPDVIKQIHASFLEIVDRLLEMNKIGVEVTDQYMFNPEHTTVAIVVPHPDAKYFALGTRCAAKLTDPVQSESVAD